MQYIHEELQAFTRGYMAALLFQASDEEGTPLDYLNYSVEDLDANGNMARIVEDCADFLNEWAHIIKGLVYTTPNATLAVWEAAGSDFLFTRQGHGTGFWDRGLGEDGDILSDAARVYGETDVSILSDGTLLVE